MKKISIFTLVLAALTFFGPSLSHAEAIALPTGITQSTSVFNETQNLSSLESTAKREDFLAVTYSLTNSGTLSQVVSPKFNLSGSLPLVDFMSASGGTLTSEVLSFPDIRLEPGQTISYLAKFRVKYNLPPFKYVVRFSNEPSAEVVVESLLKGIAGEPVYTAPVVGGKKDLLAALLLASSLSFGFYFVKRKIQLS